MSYANGADSLGNASSTSPGNRLGGDGSGPFRMTPVEIAIICVVFAIFSAIVSLVIYCRVLHQRREVDWENQRRERKRRAQAFYGSPIVGQGIELAEGNGGSSKDPASNPSTTSTERLVAISLSALPGISGGVNPATASKDTDNESADLEAAVHDGDTIERKSIWKYVHWRDQNPLERRRHTILNPPPPPPPRRSRWARVCRRPEPEEDASQKNPYV